ncbi:MipA/OmpV family protein [Stenotrophobium rhamnosiphilum]|uniref:MipA/OmpV family protein n=1 Tax=Stenotrophobium rhamnosiphilum TaxID=2029166 RepID=A0A2T5MJ61_9GAMM|nr:MipA/OmpV family protein [Stenotrophobium rhamnosiphilum]PTU32610.1 hypothetical protein CJD38_00335 [Stenotrophobium rhamnosiphilum]
MKSFCCSLAIASTVLLQPAYADDVFTSAPDDLKPALAAKPKWEIGVAALGAYVFDYPGSDQNHRNTVVLPFGIYRSNLLSADQDGVRSKLAKTNRWELNVGASAGFSTKSDRNADRKGMPDLDFILELGPSLEYKLGIWDRSTLTAVGQVRTAFAARSDIKYIGITAEPQLTYDRRAFLHPRMQLRIDLASKFGFDGFNDYYYDVIPKYATPTRPAYSSKNGYLYSSLGTRLFVAATPRLSVFVANQLLLGKGSANADSPLFKNSFNYAFGAGFAYSLFVSKDQAYRD